MPPQIERRSATDLAVFGAPKLFAAPKSTSNLVQPDFTRFLDYARPIFAHGGGASNTVAARLEERLAAFHEVAHCVTFCSGFWALAITITVLARAGRREVVMPSLTYRRMADVVAWTRLVPRFCEVDPHTLAISAETAAPCISDDTALLLAVHPIVNCCDAQGLADLAKRERLPLLIDAVESVYERVDLGGGKSKKVGGFGDAECFSLHASKLINGFEGGYVTTNDSALAATLATLRDGSTTNAGAFDARLPDVHAAMTLANLDELDAQVELNRARYARYQMKLRDAPGIRLLEFDDSLPTSYKNIVVELLDDWPLPRQLTIAILNAENILARAYYAPPLHRKPMAYPYVPAELPATDRLAERFMLLPCGDFVTLDDIDMVVDLLAFVHQHADAIQARAAEGK